MFSLKLGVKLGDVFEYPRDTEYAGSSRQSMQEVGKLGDAIKVSHSWAGGMGGKRLVLISIGIKSLRDKCSTSVIGSKNRKESCCERVQDSMGC